MTPSSERSNSVAPFKSSQPETTGTGALAPRHPSKAMSLFELDESLRLLLDSAWEAAEDNNGEIPQELQKALLDYCEGVRREGRQHRPIYPRSGSRHRDCRNRSRALLTTESDG